MVQIINVLHGKKEQSPKSLHQSVTIKAETPITEAMRLMTDHKIGYIVVCDSNDNVDGVLSERDIIRELVNVGDKVTSMLTKDLMTSNPITCTSQDNAIDVLRNMNSRGFRHMPIVDNGKLVGVISNRDILKTLFGHVNTNVLISIFAEGGVL